MAGVSVFTPPSPFWGSWGRRWSAVWIWDGWVFLIDLCAKSRELPESLSAFSPTVPGAGPLGVLFVSVCLESLSFSAQSCPILPHSPKK